MIRIVAPLLLALASAGCASDLVVTVAVDDPQAPRFTATQQSDGAALTLASAVRVFRCDPGCPAADDSFFLRDNTAPAFMWGASASDHSVEGSSGPLLPFPIVYGARAPTTGNTHSTDDLHDVVPLTSGQFTVGVQRVDGATYGDGFATFTIP